MKSEKGPDKTTIDGRRLGAAIRLNDFSEGGFVTIEGFTITRGSSIGGGGGILLPSNLDSGNSNLTVWLENNIVIDNYSTRAGGGIFINGSFTFVVLRNSLIAQNTAAEDGGGLSIATDKTSGNWVSLLAENCTIADNIALNDGGGLLVGEAAHVRLENSIIYNNTGTRLSDSQVDIVDGASGVHFNVDYCNIEGGWESITGIDGFTGSRTNSFDLPPLFASGPFGDYYLSAQPLQSVTSPCVDRGHPGVSSVLGTTRTDGKEDDIHLDLGYHYSPHLPIPDLKVNGLDGNFQVSVWDEVFLTGGVDPGYLEGVPHDWWLKAERDGVITAWWDLSGVWITSPSPVRAWFGSLSAIEGFPISNGTLPPGEWKFTFVLDARNGVFEGTYADSVTVTVQ
ncbi:MAG: right-handed parallel beta-helix repeat-containing protein [Planctomycetota bacterium]|nr:MAG: right-handed parallel beta-helix repeat-containing protein [Planctomycetota bacterium]